MRSSLVVLLAGLACSCSNTGGSGSTPCTADSQCSSGEYCELQFAGCGSGNGSVFTGGHCFLNCMANDCVCSTDDECPEGTCSGGKCHGLGIQCANPTQCDPGCSVQTPPHEPCPFCVCSSCPGADGGSTDGGSPDGGSQDGGSTDGGGDACGNTCTSQQTCCVYYGGVFVPDGGGGTPLCTDLGPDGGCPLGGVCVLDSSGGIESCNFYEP